MDLKKANRISKRLSRQYGIVQVPEVIPMKYSRMGKRAIMGYANEEQNAVELNKYILIFDWPDEPIIETIKHELMHALSYQIYGDTTGHDKRFKDLCRRCGITGDATRSRSSRGK